MADDTLKLRSQLVVSRQGTREDTVFIIKDPVSGRFFRLKEAEYSIAQQLDGATPLHVVRQRMEEKLGVALEFADIAAFVEQLGRLGLLEKDAARRQPARPRRRVRGSLLYLRFGAFDPDRLLSRLAGKVRFFFTPYFLVVSVAVILCAFAVAVLERGAIARGVRDLWRFDALLLAWFIVLSVTTLHEFAHGLTCKHFGGDVHEMGFMLIYFQPAFYCNVSDAWLFPEKSRRLWVTFAGAYFEVFLWAVATLGWRLLEPGNWLSFLALVVMATSGIKSMFNLNPLIKLDGYYLLSDYLEIPNLRQKAIGYLSARVRFRKPAAAGRVDARERRIYLLYGLLAWSYSTWLLVYVGKYFGSYLTGRYQAYGLILFAGLLAVFFRRRLAGLLSKTGARSKMAYLRRPASAVGLSAGLLALLFLGRLELKVSGPFRVLPRHNADVCTQVEGIVEEVFVDEGTWVRAGDAIARLSNRSVRAELDRSTAEIAQKRAELRRLTAGARPEEIEVSRRELDTANARLERARKRYQNANGVRAETLAKVTSASEKAKERLVYAERDLGRVRALLEGGLISRKQFDEAEEQVAVRRRELDEARADLGAVVADDLAELQKGLSVATNEAQEAQAKLGLLLAGSRKEDVAATQAELARVEARRRDLEEQIRLTLILAPTSGIVTTPSLTIKEKIGRYAGKGDLIVEVHDLESIVAEIAVPEREIADVAPGQRVVVRSRAYPGRSFAGRVKSIASSVSTPDENARAVYAGGERVVLVTTELENPSRLLKPEMIGHAKIYCGERRIFDLITRRLSGYLRTEFWSWW